MLVGNGLENEIIVRKRIKGLTEDRYGRNSAKGIIKEPQTLAKSSFSFSQPPRVTEKKAGFTSDTRLPALESTNHTQTKKERTRPELMSQSDI